MESSSGNSQIDTSTNQRQAEENFKKVNFSFLKFFNVLKGVSNPKMQTYDDSYLEQKADKKTKDKFLKFFKWCDQNGIKHPKVKYPVLFGQGSNQYPGMLATEDIGKDEIMITVPSKCVFSTKICYLSEIQFIFDENPEVFGKHTLEGEDNVLCSYILYELGKGDKSFWFPMFEVWPKDTDILVNWDEEEIEWLQDPTLVRDHQRQYQDLLTSWKTLYQCLCQYPSHFSENSISLTKYKWVYILTTNRCFGSNWPGVCAMIPYAELINHENVDVQYDYLDLKGESIACIREGRLKEEKEEKIMNLMKRKLFLDELKNDLIKLEEEFRAKQKLMDEKESQSNAQSQETVQKNDQKNEKDVVVKPFLGHGQNRRDSEEINSDDDDAPMLRHESVNRRDFELDYSSGIESDHDVDLLVEQEVLNAMRVRKQKQKQEEEEKLKRGELPPESKKMSKEEASKLWLATVAQVPDEYNFVLKTYNEEFPKGSQVYLCYGRMSNREMLKRYGFCLQYNKYNYIYIKLRLEQSDPEFVYRQFIIKKFFSIDPTSQRLDVSSRHFKIYYQRLNTKILKFMKILNLNIKEDDITCIVESRSLSLEYISFQRLKRLYDEFLDSFPTKLSEDIKILKEQRENLNVRQYFGLIYRIESKKILVNQLRLIQIIIHILERMMKGMQFEFATTRVYELESKKEYPLNRIMIENYLKSLKSGLDKNREDYMKLANTNLQQMLDESRKMKKVLPRAAYRQFEIKGYDQMIERILDIPIKSSKENNNKDLENKLLIIKESIRQQINIQNQMFNDRSVYNQEKEGDIKDKNEIKEDQQREEQEELSESEYESEDNSNDNKSDKEEQDKKLDEQEKIKPQQEMNENKDSKEIEQIVNEINQ